MATTKIPRGVRRLPCRRRRARRCARGLNRLARPTSAESFGEELRQVLDVASWRLGGDLAEEYPRIEREVREALAQEDEHQRRIRTEVFPKLMDPAAAPGCGVFAANMDVLRLIHRGLLFNGGVEACDQDRPQRHRDPSPDHLYQIGVSLVSYRGRPGTSEQRLFRRDLRQEGILDADEIVEFLEGGAGRRFQPRNAARD